MSVKHIEYLKVKDSKLLVVEVRPVKCLLDTPSGPTYTDKWMQHSHWKALHHLLTDIADEYEEQKANQQVKCNQPKCKTGGTLQIGYMFRELPPCWCSLHFLTPRRGYTWTESDDCDSEKLQDKGGRFEDLVACGDMLIISVILCDPGENCTEPVLSQTPSTSHQQACVNKKLIKALDSRIKYTNSISGYFNTSSASGKDSSSKSVSSTSEGSKTSSSVRVKTFRGFDCKKKDNCSTVEQDVDGYNCCANIDPSTHLENHKPQGEGTEKDESGCDFNGAQLIHNYTSEDNSLRELNNSTQVTVKKENSRDLLGPEIQSINPCLSRMKRLTVKEEVNADENLENNSETLETKIDGKIRKEFMKMSHETSSYGVSYETHGNYCFTQVKEEAYSDSESHHSDSCVSSVSLNVGMIHIQQENVDCEAQGASWLVSGSVYDSCEQNIPQHVLHNVSLSEKVKGDIIGGNSRVSAGCISPEASSLFVSHSPNSAQSVHMGIPWEDDREEWYTVSFDTDIEMEVGKGESPHRTDRECALQRDTRKRNIRMVRGDSSSSECTPPMAEYSSESVDRPFMLESSKQEPQKYLSEVNNHVEFTCVTIDHNVDGYPPSSTNCANVPPNELKEESSQAKNFKCYSNPKKRSKEMHSLEKTLKSNEYSQQITQPILDTERLENLVASDMECRNSIGLGMKHDNVKKKVTQRKYIPERKPLQVQKLEGSDLSCEEECEFDLSSTPVKEESPPPPPTPPPETSQEDNSLGSLDVSVVSCTTSECPETPPNCPDVQFETSITSVSEEASPCPSFKKNVERKKLIDILRSVRCFTTHDEENTQNKDARKLASKNKYCKRRNAEEIKKKASSMKSDVNEIKESMEMPSNDLHPALNEKNSETEESYSSLISDREGELEGCYSDDLSAHQSSMGSSAAPEVDDLMNDILLGNHGDEPQTSSFVSYPEYAIKKQRNYHNVLCPTILYDEENEDIKVKSENNIRSNISSTHNYNPSVQAKRSCKGDTEADHAREVDESEGRMGDHAFPHDGDDEEYVPKNVKSKRIKQHRKNLPNPVHVPTMIPSLTRKRLFVAENSTTPEKKSNESNHSTEDLMERNSIESSPKCTSSITSESSSIVEESQSPESNANLRRSSRIKGKLFMYTQESWTSFDSSDQDSNVSDSSSEIETLDENEKKKKGKSLKYVKKKIEISNDLKQTKIEKYIKRNSTPKKQYKKKVQLKTPDKEDSILTNKSKKRDGSSELCKSMKKKSNASKASDQKTFSKPSSSIHKAQGSKKNADLNYYNAIWSFNLPGEQNKKGKSSNTTKQKRNISTLEKSQSVSSEKPTKEIKTNKALGRKSKSNVENCAPDGIDDEFYWRIQEETDKLSALMKDSDDVLVNRTSSDGKPGKSNGKEKQVHNKKNSRDEECCILNELEESPHNLDALRSSYKQLHNMTNNDLEQRLNNYLPYFEEIIRGNIPNERHEMYKKSSSNELRMQQDYLIYGPFTADQSLYVLDLLKEKLGHMDKLIGNTYDILSYRCRVLVPTFFTKIVMDNENVNLKEAHRLMVKFTYNRDIADDLRSADSIKL